MQHEPVSLVLVTQPMPSQSSPTSLLVTAASPAAPWLLNSDLLSVVDLSSVPFSNLVCNTTQSSQPTGCSALNLSASSVWLLQAVYDSSASPSQPPLLLVVVLELQTALSYGALATGYDMQLTLTQEPWFPSPPPGGGAPPPGPPPGPPPNQCGGGGAGGGGGGPPPGSPPPPPSAAVTVFSAGEAPPGSVAPASTSQSLSSGESTTAGFEFAGLPYQLVCVPTESAVNSAYSSSLLAFTIVIPLFVALLSTLWLVSHSCLQRADGIAAAPHPRLALTASSSAVDGDKKQHGSAGLHVLAYFLDRLNNPLHQILSLLAFLEENTRHRAAADAQHADDRAAGGAGDSEARAVDLDIISSIRQQAMIMSAVIQDASDIRALEAAGGMQEQQLQPLHLASLLQSVSAQLRPQAQEKGVSVLCSVDASVPVVYGDGRRVAQLLRALLSSVISLHSVHGSIIVTVKPAAAAAISRHSKERKEEAGRGRDSKAQLPSSSPTASPLSKLRQHLHVDTDRSTQDRTAATAAVAAAPALPPSLPLVQLDSTSSSSSFSAVPLTAAFPLFATASSSTSSQASTSTPLPLTPCLPVLIRVVLIGCAIRREKLSSLFNPFNPSSPAAVAHQEGLGLALVNTIVTALKGRVEVHSSQSSTAFHVLLPFALTGPAVSGGAGAGGDGPVSPFAFPSQADGGNDDGYAVRVRVSDDGVEVEDVTLLPQSGVNLSPASSHRDDVAAAAQAKGPTPASKGRRVKGDGAAAADDKEEEERDQYSAETELASVATSHAAAAFSSSASSAVVTPTFVFRSSGASLLTPSSSPTSAGLSVSTASPSSAFQLYTPSALLLRSSTEALPYPNLSSPSHHRYHPYHQQAAQLLAASSPQFSTVSVGSSYASGSGSGLFPGGWLPYASSAGHERRERRKSGSASEMSLMTRQVQEAKQKMRTEGASYDQPDRSAAAQPLSLIANPRRLSESTADVASTETGLSAAPSTSASASYSASSLPTSVPSSSSSSSSQAAMSESPMHILGRAASAPGTSAAAYRGLDRVELQSSFVLSGDAGEARMPSLHSPASSPALAVEAAAAACSEPRRVLPSSGGAPRSLSNTPTTASSVLPAHYALLTPSAPLNAAPHTAEAGVAVTAGGPMPSSGTPPIAPRQKAPLSGGKKISRTVDLKRAATSAADGEERARCDSVRRQLQSSSVLVVDDAEINVKIALRMLTGIDCVTATDGLQAVEHFRRRSGIDDRPADGSGRAAAQQQQQMSPASSATSPPSVNSPSSSSSAPTQQPTSFVFSPSSVSASSSPSFHLPASAEPLPRAQTADTFSPAAAPFALLLMDVVMPVMSGLEATRIIRSLCAQHRLPYYTPIIAVTGNCTAQDRKAANAAGFDFLLAKPFTRAQLFEVIEMALSKKEAEERRTAAGARAAKLGRTSPTFAAPAFSLAAAGRGKQEAGAAAGGAEAEAEAGAGAGSASGGGGSTPSSQSP